MRSILRSGLLVLALTTFASPEEKRPYPYFELRLYSVTSNKLDAVIERFRDTVQPVRRKHGITTVGYWTSARTNGDKFIYLMAAEGKADLEQKEREFGVDPDFKSGYVASNTKHGKTVDKIVSLPLSAEPGTQYDLAASKTPRVFDLRLYSVLPGKLDSFRSRWRDRAVPIYERHGLHSLGWWVAAKQEEDGNNLFVCLLAGDSAEAIQKAVGEFHADPEWKRVEQETESQGKLWSSVTAYTLLPADFSPLK